MTLTELLTVLQQIKDCRGGNCKITIEHHGIVNSLRNIRQVKIKEVEFDLRDFVEDRGGFPIIKAGSTKPCPLPIIILEEGDKIQV